MSTSDDDKTRIKPHAPTPDDKTRITPHKKTAHKSAAERAAELEEKLRKIQAIKAPPPTDDKTTLLNEADTPASVSPPDAPEPPQSGDSDKTQFMPNKNTAHSTRPTEPEKDLDDEAPVELGLLKNRFILESVLGAGGMGVVYKAKDKLKIEAQDRDPYVAVKVLGEEFKTHPEAFISLQRESRKSQRIAHPNIVNVHDFDRDGDTVFMTMEFLDGDPLDKLIAKYRSIGLPTDDVWKILEGISLALEHAHKEQIIHSDFKPGNIFFTNKGVSKVFDFGIARAVQKVEHIEQTVDDKTMFDAGSLGAITPAYASLEMLEGEVPDVRDDIYALGCIAYELFTGEHPYGRVNARDAAEQKLKLKRIPGLTKRQWRAIEKACAFKREDRIETVHDFWQEMTLKKSRTGWVVTALMLLTLGVGGAYTQFFMEKAPEFSEADARDEIEFSLRVELQKKALDALMASMLFTPGWEAEIWREFQSSQELLGADDTWLVAIKNTLYQAYIEKIDTSLENKTTENVSDWITHAERYTRDTAVLGHFANKLAGILAEQERQRKAKEKQDRLAKQQQIQQRQVKQKQQAVVAERRSAYNAAIETVRSQLSCRANINMKDLGTAIKKLRELDIKKYQKEEPQFVNSLALCLEKIGKNYPERAKDSKKAAVRLFPGNQVIAGIKIVPRDPCSASIAGLGAKGTRAICRDRISRVGQGPSLVVIPAAPKGKMFALAKYETSVDDINTFCDVTQSCEKLPESNTTLPVTNVPLSTLTRYMQWLSVETKQTYRLPTQQEWLHAAKAGRGKLDSNRNCTLSSRGIEKGGSLLKATVGKQNAWGVVNHIGNAQEIVTKRGGGLLVVGGAHKTPMSNCTFDYSERYSGNASPLTTLRLLREIKNVK